MYAVSGDYLTRVFGARVLHTFRWESNRPCSLSISSDVPDVKDRDNNSAEAGGEWLAGEDGLERSQSLHPLFAQGGEIASDTTERGAAAGGAETPGDLLLDLEHPEIPFCLVVIKGNGEVVVTV